MLVSASTACFPDLSLSEALEKITDLEYSNVEIAIHEDSNQLKPSQVLGDFENAMAMCHRTRLTTVAYSVDIHAEGEE